MWLLALRVWAFMKRSLSPAGWALVALLVVILITGGTCTALKVRNHFERNDAVKANNADRELREDLSVKRQDNVTAINTEERQLNEALSKLPDAVPSDRRLTRACRELRADRHVELPAECRSLPG